MRLELRAVREHRIAGSVILTGLCVIGWVYSDALQLKDRTSSPAPAVAVAGIAEISKPFSYANSTAKTHAPKIVTISAEDLPALEPESRKTQGEERESAQPALAASYSAPDWLPTPGRYEASRQGMLSFRRSLPTFDQTRSTIRSRNLSAAGAARYLDTPFNSLLDSVFKRSSDETVQAVDFSRQKQDVRNPFTEAKQKADSEPLPAAAAAPPAPPPAPPAKDTASPADQNANAAPPPSQPPASGGAPKPTTPEGPLLVLGDFSGTGTMEAWSASRIDDGTFAFKDGQRTFNLYINPEAVGFQRSFAIDDFNGDGIADLLVTSRAALAGGVLLGDGKGNYKLSDTFITGYEPVVPVPGRMGDGSREILSVDVRTGSIQTFRRIDSGGYCQVRGQATINFIPDFLARVTEIDSGKDSFIAAQSGKAAAVWRWQEDGSLSSSGESIPPAPSVSIFKSFLQDNAQSNLQIYQVGSSASVLLINSQGNSFNVANFRVTPQIFLMVGDLLKRGTLDVAVAFLLSSTPAK